MTDDGAPRRTAGQGAREQQAQLRAGKPTWRLFAERALDVHTDERAWRKGAEGEELVGRRLDKLNRDWWRVVHDLTVNEKGTNIDHLVIGRAGIFTVNTKKLTGRITITDTGVYQNGKNHRIVEAARSEARRVRDRMSAATGMVLPVLPVIIIVHPLRGPEPKFKGEPDDCKVMFSTGMRMFFWRQRGDAIAPGHLDMLERVALTPGTWLG